MPWNKAKRVGGNLLLAAGSVLLVFVASLGVDRTLGLYLHGPEVPECTELLFPPGLEHRFETPEFRYVVRTNLWGLRDGPIARDRGDTYRIAALGDSFTYGFGVDIEETWLKQLEARLHEAGYDVETVNLGKPGAGLPQYAELAARAIPMLEPDLIVVALLQGDDILSSWNDQTPSREIVLDCVARLWPNLLRWARGEPVYVPKEEGIEGHPFVTTAEQHREGFAKQAREDLAAMTAEERVRFDALDEAVKRLFLEGNLNPYMVSLGVRASDFLRNGVAWGDGFLMDSIAKSAEYLATIAREARLYGAEVLVLSVPFGAYVNRHALDTYRRVGYEVDASFLESEAPDRAVAVACAPAGLAMLSVTEAFRARRDDATLFYEMDGHLTPKGHAFYAEELADRLIARFGATWPKLDKE